MRECIFCKIVSGEIPSQKIYEDEKILVFKDINPEAPVHVLFIPKKHIANLNSLEDQDSEIISHIFITSKKITKELGIEEGGYRIVANCGKNAGQTVDHIHFHLLGGRNLSWPPG